MPQMGHTGDVMVDHIETEIKFYLPDPAAMRVRLLGLGAVCHGEHAEYNIRLDDTAGSIEARKMVLRIRSMTTDAGTTHLLTVKAHEDSMPDLSSRREIELEIADGNAMVAALAVLGYTPYFIYEKRRETFDLHGCEVVIDEMPYGWFMEIEGTADAIRARVDELGLDLADGFTCGYSRIFANVVRALGLDITDLTFEAFEGISVEPDLLRC
jgi:adenylate cyclase, class 2